MGITQNFYAVEKEDIINDFDFSDNHGEKYGWNEFANFSKEHEIYNWMYNLWKEKVAMSPSHGDNSLTEEYLLLNKDDILRLEKDFRDKKYVSTILVSEKMNKRLFGWRIDSKNF